MKNNNKKALHIHVYLLLTFSLYVDLMESYIDILGNDILGELTFWGMNILVVDIMVLIRSCNYVCIVCVYPCKCVHNIKQCCFSYIVQLLLYQIIVGVADHILGGDISYNTLYIAYMF